DRRILPHAELPAHHAPSEDRDELARLVACPPDDLVDRAAGRGFRHHHVAVRPRGGELAACDAPARSQHIVEAGLDDVLLEVVLSDPPGAGKMIKWMSRAGTFPGAGAGGLNGAMPPVAAAPSAAPPALRKKPRRSICDLPLMSCSSPPSPPCELLRPPWAARS